MTAAASASALGDHAEAVRQLTLAMEASSATHSGSPHLTIEAAISVSQCFIKRAMSHREIGDLKAAVCDCSGAIELIDHHSLNAASTAAAADSGALKSMISALTIRSYALEQLERYAESAADLSAVVRLSSAGESTGGLAAVALARVRSAAKAAAALAAANRPKADSWMSVPRPGLRRFENRGKAGKAF